MVKLFGLKMFDRSSGELLWECEDVPDQAYNFVLTETFCGFMYTEMEMETSQCSIGSFNLVLLDCAEGNVIYHERCWDFYWKEDFDIRRSSVMPSVTASGNYLFACASSGDYPTHGLSGEFGNSLLCVKVDPESNTCKVRRTNTGLEMALYANTLSQDTDAEWINPYESPFGKVGIEHDFVSFLGFASDSVIVGQAEFHYFGIDKSWHHHGTSVFTIDLDKILDMQEPASVFSAFNFPLRSDVFDTFTALDYRFNKDDAASCWKFSPYFQTEQEKDGSNKVGLAGIIEFIDKDFKPLEARLYSFKKHLEVKELISEEETEPVLPKRAKLE